MRTDFGVAIGQYSACLEHRLKIGDEFDLQRQGFVMIILVGNLMFSNHNHEMAIHSYDIGEHFVRQ